MTPQTPGVETLLAEAVEIPDPAERAAYLDRACGPDGALRARLDRLVADHFRAGSFLERPPAEVDPDATTAAFEPGGAGAAVGTRLGPYALRELLGEGGMGAVYVAEQQEPVRRRVALKVIKPGMDSKQVVARFEAERQALALMDHPNIARILDGGSTPEGRPFFVMELVRGVPITEYCDRAGLGTRERLGLFLQICAAVQHAHQKGVIHRDLKPSNVLVTLYDGVPVPKVIDFGIAKAVGQSLTEKTVYTRFAQLVGTPLYMSPEQAKLSALDVDTRSDVYALGVLLYELLTGVTPFDPERFRAAGFDEVRRMIREDEPPRPSHRLSTLAAGARSTVSAVRGVDARRLAAQLRGELDWVVMRCLEKDRNRRYESVGALAADVQRHLSDEPVLARPPSRWYRLRKAARRNREPVAATALLLLALAAGAVGTAWGLIEARRERDATGRERDAARQSEATARQAELDAKEFGDFLVSLFLAPDEGKGYASEFLNHNFGMASREEALLVQPGVDVKMSEALAAAEKRSTSAGRRRPIAEAGVRHAMGLAWFKLGRPADAARQLRMALELRERTLGPDHEDTVTSAAALGRVLVAAGRPGEAIPVLENVRARREDKLGTAFRAANGYHPAQALVALYDLAQAYRAAGRLPEATRLLEELNRRQLDNIRPDRPNMGGYVAYSPSVVRDLAAAYRAAGRGEDAERLFADSFSKLRSGLGPSSYQTQRVRLYWSAALFAEAKFDKAVEVNRESVDAVRRDGSSPYQLAVGLWHLGDSLLAAGRPAEAEAVLRESLALWEKMTSGLWPKFDVESLLGETLLRQGRSAEAEPLLVAGYAGLVGSRPGPDPYYPAAAADRLAELYVAVGKREEAAKWRAERAKYPPERAPPPRPVGPSRP